MQYCELELAVGDVIRLENCTITVLDIDNGEFTVRVDHDDDQDPFIGLFTTALPR